jgi:hypothetical protein
MKAAGRIQISLAPGQSRCQAGLPNRYDSGRSGLDYLGAQMKKATNASGQTAADLAAEDHLSHTISSASSLLFNEDEQTLEIVSENGSRTVLKWASPPAM